MSNLTVFICHSSSDKPAARELYQRLKAEGFAPWLDEEDLLPGQNWKKVIPKVVASAHVVVVCLSSTAVTKQGFVQKEISYALDVANEQPEEAIFIIPVRLEECTVPDRLSEWQWVNLYEPRGYDRLLRSLRHRAESLQDLALDAPVVAPRSAAAKAPPQPMFWQKNPEADEPAATTEVVDEGFGVALGFNLVWLNGNPFNVEAEISSYVDDPGALGATLAFHPLHDVFRPEAGTEIRVWRQDVDEDLTRDESAPLGEQFRSITLQLGALSEERLRDYLLRALDT